jgi:hypothetical protein
VSTFIELKEQAEQDIRAHIPRPSSDSAEHFVADTTNYFVERGAVLLAALRLWAEPRQETDADLRALIDSASARTLVNIARELAKVAILMSSMPACSLKVLLTNLDAN